MFTFRCFRVRLLILDGISFFPVFFMGIPASVMRDSLGMLAKTQEPRAKARWPKSWVFLRYFMGIPASVMKIIYAAKTQEPRAKG